MAVLVAHMFNVSLIEEWLQQFTLLTGVQSLAVNAVCVCAHCICLLWAPLLFNTLVMLTVCFHNEDD